MVDVFRTKRCRRELGDEVAAEGRENVPDTSVERHSRLTDAQPKTKIKLPMS